MKMYDSIDDVPKWSVVRDKLGYRWYRDRIDIWTRNVEDTYWCRTTFSVEAVDSIYGPFTEHI